MRSVELTKLEGLIKSSLNYKSLSEDDEFHAMLAKYVCISIAGLIENAIRLIIERYLRNTYANSPVSNYITSKIREVNNPSYEVIKKTFKAFDFPWWDNFHDYCHQNDQEILNSLSTIMTNRHNIAHGRDVGITLRDMERHLPNVIKMIEFLEDALIPVRQVY